ncbi:IclR family transcriptional regulator (plasmid) [Haloferacaceae archaeon DSL9]
MTRLGNVALRQHTLSGLVEDVAENLAAQTGGIAHVAVMQKTSGVWLYTTSNVDLEGWDPKIGLEFDLHSTAYGQAILAGMSTDDLAEFLSEASLEAHTDRTLATPTELTERLETIRDVGFAYSAGEFVPNITSVAAPITSDTGNEIIGAIGITNKDSEIGDPYRYMKARRFYEETPRLILRAARIASDRLE